MSYDIELCEPIGGEVIQFETPHMIRGGTYAIYGTQEAWLNITYNYGKHYRRVFGENGIRTIYGMTGAESIPIIKAAMENCPTIFPKIIGKRRKETRKSPCGIASICTNAP